MDADSGSRRRGYANRDEAGQALATQRASHYLATRLPDQFQLVVHVDRTRALEPLETWSRHEVDLPDTWPTGV
ncbi:MAG: hypothetical protein AB7H93_20195 [Vicinamibacterales bacterium]